LIDSRISADFDRLALLDEEGWTANNHYHRMLLKQVPRGCGNALEIGCGTGSFARQLAERCKRVFAIDLSSEMIRVARERSSERGRATADQRAVADERVVGVENIEYELADVMTWEFPKSQFDFICSSATLHHLNQRELLPKMRDALRPGGVLVVLDLARSEGFGERILDLAALGVSGTLRLLHNGRLQPPPEVRQAWEQHGKQDHYLTTNEVRALADEMLPGSKVKRLLLWRYTLVYQNQVRP
jgi:SAM-dependent methyltransferase